jgi:hypothetical protein
MWYPKISPGGMIAGHDYCDYHDGVVRAVNEFATDRGLIVYVTSDGGISPSWYAYKP